MKITFKIFALALLLIACLTTANAQRGRSRDVTPEAKAEQQASRMKKDLGLTDEQVQKIKEINLKYAKKAQDKRNEKAAEKEKIRAEREAAQAEHQKEIDSVLTKEQQEKWAKIRQKRPERKGPGKEAPPHKGGYKEHKSGKPIKQEDRH